MSGATAVWRLPLAAAFFFAAIALVSPSRAASGPFAAMAGTWVGGGFATLNDGSKERIRCRASYAVSGPNMNMVLTCASAAYKFNLQASVVDEGGAISGNWTESSRNVAGTLRGHGRGGAFDVVASSAGFDARISLRTAGNRQSITMSADSQFRGASISLSR